MASEPEGLLPSCFRAVGLQSGIFYGDNPLKSTTALLMVQISLVLLISSVLQIVLKPLKQPRIVCDMIAGLIIGPSLLGHYKEFAAFIFPDRGDLMVKLVSELGKMLFFFITGVQMDISLITKPGKRAHTIATFGVLLPAISLFICAFLSSRVLGHDTSAYYQVMGAMASSIAVTSAHVLYPILKELKLLNTDVGRLALSITVVTDFFGWVASIMIGYSKQTTLGGKGMYLASMIGYLILLITVIRPAAMWVNQRTPAGHKVDQHYVVLFFAFFLISGLFTDSIGATIIQGPVLLGFLLPDGPPLGATLVERSEVIMSTIFMPIFFAHAGLNADIFSLRGHSDVLLPLMFAVLVGYLAKFLGTLLPAVYYGMPFRDAISLCLIVSCRGQAELIILLLWKQHMNVQIFTVILLCTILVTSIMVPLICMIYEPTRSYKTNKRRTILSSASESSFDVVVCVHQQECIPGLIDLIKASNPTRRCPISVYVLHLVELIGRAAPIFISHHNTSEKSKHSSSDTIWKALKIYKKSVSDFVTFNLFTAVAPYKTMHHEICKLAVEKKAALIILPINNSSRQPSSLSPWGIEAYNASWLVNSNVLSYAPCSVGIFIDRNPNRNLAPRSSSKKSSYNVIVLFLGGVDAREALAYADKMADQGHVSLTIVRFLPVGDDVVDDQLEKDVDEQLFKRFTSKNSNNNQIEYSDIEVQNGEETISAIQELNNNHIYDLWIVGRQRGVNPVLVKGISAWDEDPQLGVIGEFISSSDFQGTASVLVIQHQVLMHKIKGKWTYNDTY